MIERIAPILLSAALTAAGCATARPQIEERKTVSTADIETEKRRQVEAARSFADRFLRGAVQCMNINVLQENMEPEAAEKECTQGLDEEIGTLRRSGMVGHLLPDVVSQESGGMAREVMAKMTREYRAQLKRNRTIIRTLEFDCSPQNPLNQYLRGSNQ